MSFIEELQWRGLLEDMTPGIEEELTKGPIVGYIGYDPTAPSLTIGNLVTIMLLKHLQLAGHRPIVLLGGATGRIGDPSGKDAERTLLDYQKLQNNYDFYKDMTVFDFLRDVGKNITVSYMLSKESVKKRMETGISFTEFSYQLIQGYDFQHLFQNHNCILQMGGSDQWGNIPTGAEFVRKSGGKGYGLVCPLLTRADGKKFGKSEEGNVWLSAEMTSPYKFYQFWVNVTDTDLPKLLRTFSLKDKATIEKLEADYADNPNALKRILAEELTERVHSKEALTSAEKASKIVFNKKLELDFLTGLSKEDLEMVSHEIDAFRFSKAALEAGVNIIDLLVTNHSSLQSKADVRRAIKGGALSVNTIKVSDDKLQITTKDLLHDSFIFLQNGKKNKIMLIAE